MPAPLALIALMALGCGPLIVFGLYLLTREAVTISEHLGGLRKDLAAARRDAASSQRGESR